MKRDELTILETRFGPIIVGGGGGGGRAPDNLRRNYECGVFNSCRKSIVEENNSWKSMEAETAGIKKDCSCSMKTDEEIVFERSM